MGFGGGGLEGEKGHAKGLMPRRGNGDPFSFERTYTLFILRKLGTRNPRRNPAHLQRSEMPLFLLLILRNVSVFNRLDVYF